MERDSPLLTENEKQAVSVIATAVFIMRPSGNPDYAISEAISLVRTLKARGLPILGEK